MDTLESLLEAYRAEKAIERDHDKAAADACFRGMKYLSQALLLLAQTCKWRLKVTDGGSFELELDDSDVGGAALGDICWKEAGDDSIELWVEEGCVAQVLCYDHDRSGQVTIRPIYNSDVQEMVFFAEKCRLTVDWGGLQVPIDAALAEEARLMEKVRRVQEERRALCELHEKVMAAVGKVEDRVEETPPTAHYESEVLP